MALDDVLLPPGLLNLFTLLLALVAWTRTEGWGRSRWILVVVVVGTGIHFVTDLLLDLGTEGEHILMHLVALGVVGVLLLPPTKGTGSTGA